MAIYDMRDPSDPKLIDFSTKEFSADRFRSIGEWQGNVSSVVKLSPHYEAHFTMTPDHAREVAVRLIDAAEEAEVRAEELTRERTEAAELVSTPRKKVKP
jgi:hypothetical protein